MNVNRSHVSHSSKHDSSGGELATETECQSSRNHADESLVVAFAEGIREWIARYRTDEVFIASVLIMFILRSRVTKTVIFNIEVRRTCD